MVVREPGIGSQETELSGKLRVKRRVIMGASTDWLVSDQICLVQEFPKGIVKHDVAIKDELIVGGYGCRAAGNGIALQIWFDMVVKYPTTKLQSGQAFGTGGERDIDGLGVAEGQQLLHIVHVWVGREMFAVADLDEIVHIQAAGGNGAMN